MADTDTDRRTYPILWGEDDTLASLTIILTDEGLVADVVKDGEVIASCWFMAQDVADDFCH